MLLKTSDVSFSKKDVVFEPPRFLGMGESEIKDFDGEEDARSVCSTACATSVAVCVDGAKDVDAQKEKAVDEGEETDVFEFVGEGKAAVDKDEAAFVSEAAVDEGDEGEAEKSSTAGAEAAVDEGEAEKSSTAGVPT